MKPKCFTQQQWDEWCELADETEKFDRSMYCYDCTAKYQSQQIRKDTCAHPKVVFGLDRGEYRGFRPGEYRYPYQARINGKGD